MAPMDLTVAFVRGAHGLSGEFKVESASGRYEHIAQLKEVALRLKGQTTLYKVERVEGSDKLLRLTVTNGEKEKQIVSGIAKFYAPEDLPGKKVILVDNLKPAKLKGIVSEGMLLASTSADGSSLKLLTVDGDIPAGSRIS